MEKVVYLLWGEPDASRGAALRSQLLREAAPALLALGGRGLTVNVHDTAAAEAPSPAPAPQGEAVHVAEVCVWVDSYDRRGAMDVVVAACELPLSAYLVVESLYDDYGTTPHAAARWWPDGERSPGVLTVALIHRPIGLSYDDWIQRWHGTQSPASAQLQPRTRYVRNEVVRALTADAPKVHGIVEEGWPSAAHIADANLFFNADGDPERLRANVQEMLAN
ncbi:MAG: hypothetical protein ABIY48_11565, partial [Acidimicrobiales bacterium]